MPFHPTGPSCRVTVSTQTPKTIKLEGLPGEKRVIRLLSMTYPSPATCFFSLGADSVTVDSETGMPLDLANGKEQFVSVGDETHLALMMNNNANYTIAVTPGEIV